MSQPLSRCLPTRNAAARAADKIKANLEQVRAWEVKDFEESNLKFSVSNHFNHKTGEDDEALAKALKQKRGEGCENTMAVCGDPLDELSTEGSESSVSSTATLLSSSCGASVADKQSESYGFAKSVHDRLSFSEVARRERAAKARARSQHSAQRMFLSRRLSRQMRGCRSPLSPIFSPLVATTLLFSPELTPYPKMTKEKRRKQKTGSQGKRSTQKSS